MKGINTKTLLNIIEYEKVRNEYRRNIINYKKDRRINLGPNIMMTFENQKTLSFQIQEIMRAERIVDDNQIQEEVNIYNTIMPPENGLSATLFIEVTDETKIKSILNKFIGLTESNTIYFKFNRHKVYAQFEQGREEKNKISSVHYLQFYFSEDQKKTFLNDSNPMELVIDYNNYNYNSILHQKMISSLYDDLNCN